jgi:hypothetical protein
MGTQLYLPAGWARRLESRLDPVERLAEFEKDRTQAKGDIREILDRLAEKHGATVRDVTVAMLSIDDTLTDLLYDQERMLLHEIEDLNPDLIEARKPFPRHDVKEHAAISPGFERRKGPRCQRISPSAQPRCRSTPIVMVGAREACSET